MDISKISDKKREFLESLGIDLNNIPEEFNKNSDDMNLNLSDEEIDFLSRENMTGTYTKQFCLRDIVGTTHPSYSEKTWLEAFANSKRGDDAIDKYTKNPSYYSEDLKKLDQEELGHDSPIELFEDNGQFYIKGGNNRISLIMMEYLSKMSKAQTDEEREQIDEEYTFVAEVNPLPKDREVMEMLTEIRKSSEDVRITKIGEEDKCQYTIQIGDEVIKINEKADLEKYLGREKDKRKEHENQPKTEKTKNKEEEKGVSQNGARINEFGEIIREENTKNIAKEDIPKFEPPKTIREKGQSNTKRLTQEEELEVLSKQIVNNLENAYKKIKEAESNFIKASKILGLSYTITSVDNMDIMFAIEKISENVTKLANQITDYYNKKDIESANQKFGEIEEISQNADVKEEYREELKGKFEKSFDGKIQDLINKSKLSELDKQKEDLQNEKVSFIGKILGKDKLKQAKIENVIMQRKLVVAKGNEEKETYSLEDSISDLKSYIENELKGKPTLEMEETLDLIEETPELKEMIDTQKIDELTTQKIAENNQEKSLANIDKPNLSSRKQAQLLKKQNEDIQKEVDESYDKTNNSNKGLEGIKIDKNSPLNKFKSVVKEISLATQIDNDSKDNNKTKQISEIGE